MKCARCQAEVFATIMSRFNTDIICIPCEEEEKQHPDYGYARDTEIAEVRKGNMNFPGVGWPGKEGRIEKRRREIRYEIPEKIMRNRPVICKGEGCRAEIYWIETESGKRMPVDPDGTPHWATCPDAGRFKRGAAR